MKLKTTIIFAAVVVIFALLAFLVLPKVLPNDTPVESSSSAQPVSSEQVRYTPQEMVNLCDTAITGKVIKADVDEQGVLYTFQVAKVYMGRNYTSMGYAYLYGEQKLESDTLYLFLGVTGTEKYHYYEPFADAPWVFSVGEDMQTLTHVSNGEAGLVQGIGVLTVEQLQEMIKARPAQ